MKVTSSFSFLLIAPYALQIYHPIRAFYIMNPVRRVPPTSAQFLLRTREINRGGGTVCLPMVGTGFSFEDGSRGQFLVSLQKPLGVVLEETGDGGCTVISLDPEGNAAAAGIRTGDMVLAVQNADVSVCGIEDVMAQIRNAPRVVNLRVGRCG